MGLVKIDRKSFLIGWRRRSALILDGAGCPMWLTRLRCPVRRGWGTVLDKLIANVTFEGETEEPGESEATI